MMYYRHITVLFLILFFGACAPSSYKELPIQESYDYNMINYKLPEGYKVEYDIPYDWHLVYKSYSTGQMGSAQSVRIQIHPAFHKGSETPIYAKPEMEWDIRRNLLYPESVYSKQNSFFGLHCYEYQLKGFSHAVSSNIEGGYGRPGMFKLQTKIYCPFRYEDGKYYRLDIEYGATNHASKEWIAQGNTIPNIYETFKDVEKDAKWLIDGIGFKGKIEAVRVEKVVKERMEINKHRSECAVFCIKRHQLRPEFWEKKYGVGIREKCNQTCLEVNFRTNEKNGWKTDLHTGEDKGKRVKEGETKR